MPGLTGMLHVKMILTLQAAVTLTSAYRPGSLLTVGSLVVSIVSGKLLPE